VGVDAAQVDGPTVEKQGTTLVFNDLGGSNSAKNELFISLAVTGSPQKFGFQDVGPSLVLAGSGCEQSQNADLALCPAGGIDALVVRTLGKADKIDVDQTGANAVTVPMDIDGGDDADTLEGGAAPDKVNGADGADKVSGGPEADRLFGAGGNDRLFGDAGDDNLNGGPDADDFNGGPGTDTADYSASTVPVDVSIGDGPNDGGVGAEVQSAGAVRAASSFLGGLLPDLSGQLRRADDVKGDIERVVGANTDNTASGDDIVGDGDPEALLGGGGGDQLEGKGGADTFAAGDGDDTVFARDGAPDAAISCGPGNDRALVDANDFVAADCEDVDRGAANADGPGFDDPPGGANDQGEGNGPGGTGAKLPPELKIVSTQVAVSKKGKASVRIRCVYLAANCVGKVKLLATKKVKAKVGGRRVVIKKGAALGSAKVKIPWGNSKPVRVKLKQKPRRILKKKTIRAKAKVRAHDSGAGAGAREAKASRQVLLFQPKRK